MKNNNSNNDQDFAELRIYSADLTEENTPQQSEQTSSDSDYYDYDNENCFGEYFGF